ncbi:MAG: rhodanese-like domain-containing protein [Rubrobacteraceae bacterium]|uniref:rhodanese-like domain-containing protein n=1 Tax=Rubrobacter naiadicus TaxID=1392641 RepID=UPI002360BD5D|nr:rhodanese-like domain-containing protein [Rubrobacter naiadicus]MBX6764155.1 rhodanese-like domain-containing protein [Rubrobacteraceae bacterium]MCL6437053.1 rhodanese-like domain-containing protein [Rubrobacteraceae bacterium]
MFGWLFGGGSSVPDLSPREAYEKLSSDGAVLLDVREYDEWEAGRVPGALHIPLGELQERRQDLPQERQILTICRSGSRSAMAAKMLSEGGVDVANVSGGVRSWKKEGLPFEGRVA